MIIQKVTILFIALFISFLKPAEVDSSSSRTFNTSYSNSPDSLKSEIRKNGWTPQVLSSFQYYLINSNLSPEKDLENLKDINNNYKKTFLVSLLLKKQNNFIAMYDSLYSCLNTIPHYIPYYNELVFAANSTGQLLPLETKIEAINNFPNREKNYLLGLIHNNRADYDNARVLFEKSLKQDSTNKFILYQLSYAYRGLGNYRKALSLAHQSKSYANGDTNFLVKVSLAEGALYFLSGEYDSADKIYKDTYQLSLKNNLREGEGLSLVALGIMDDIQGFIEQARDKYNEALEISNTILNIELQAYALSELGVSFSYTNELIEAKANYLKSYDLYKKTRNKLRLSLLSDNIGKIYMSIFNYESAIKYYQEGIDFAGENKRAIILNLTGLGDAYSNLANYSEALKYYSRARKLSREMNEIELNINVNTGLGALNFNLDKPNNALNYYRQAEFECSKINNPFLTADIYEKLGVIYSSLDSLNTSEKYFTKAQDIAVKNNAAYTEVLAGIDLAEILVKKKNYVKAFIVLNEASKKSLSHGFTYLQARAEILKGNIFEKKNDFDRAKSAYNNALNTTKNLNEKNLLVETYYDLAKLFDSKNLNEAAESYYLSAIKIIEDVSRPLFSQNDVQISYFSENKNIYDSFAEHYLKQKKYEQAFELINKSHSRNMIQNLNNLKLQSMIEDSTVLSTLYDYDWIIHSGIYDSTKTEIAINKLSRLKASLIDKNPRLAPYLNMEKWPSLNEIQNSLTDDENLISYYSTTNKTYAFLITRTSFKPFDFDLSKNQLDDLINNISPYFERSNVNTDAFYNQDLFSFNAEASYQLYKMIVEPVVKNIPEDKRIIISPSIELVSFPFEFLVTDYKNSESPYDYRNKNYLISKYDISYTPSATAFLKQQNSDLKNNGKVLLVGDPAINTGTQEFAERRGMLDDTPGIPRNLAFLPLKYSGEEVNSIGEIINANTILLNNNATETNFKQNAELSRIIHLSTHSFLYNKQPLIFFSNSYDTENDGFLEASEIVQLKLNSDLVVLSSCNSGLGNIDESEGILGFTKAFFEAGTKSIIVSLWDVNDKYTAKLMTLFYDKLSSGYDKSKALRLAKMEFIKKYSPNPYYWSAFVLLGNISPVELKQNRDMSLSIIILILIISAALLVVFIIKRNKITSSNNL
jgi:CHAT domain-containing protein